MTCSMSRKGNCWDNAPTESWFDSFKNERVHGIRYATRRHEGRKLRIHRGFLQPEAAAFDTRLQVAYAVPGKLARQVTSEKTGSMIHPLADEKSREPQYLLNPNRHTIHSIRLT